MLAYATFPGVDQVVSARYSLEHGVTPSVATLEIAPQPGFTGEGGPLTFVFGQTTLIFPECKVDSASFERNGEGAIWRLRLLDRRWRWAFGSISGAYNLRHETGEVVRALGPAAPLIAATERTPQQLAILCLQAMGEVSYSVADLPNDTRPLVEWDYDNPAQMLAELCDALDCRVVLQLDGLVALRRRGLGLPLPAAVELIERSLTIDPPERPDFITVVTGRVRHQVDLILEAVGLDRDGAIKKLDDLSYKPTAPYAPNGWSDIDLETFSGIADAKFAELARRSVFRWYRVVTPFTLVGWDNRSRAFVQQVIAHPLEIELLDEQLDVVTDDGLAKNRPAAIWGIWFDGGLQFANVASELRVIADFADDYAKKTIYPGEFRIDSGQGLVKFARRVYRLDAESRPAAARLILRTSVLTRDRDRRAWSRYERTRFLGGAFATQPRVARRDDLLPGIATRYDPAPIPPGVNPNDPSRQPLISGFTHNGVAVDQAADRYLDAIEHEYQGDLPESASYAGLLLISPDGAIQQVAWSIGPEGVTTQVSRNQEISVRSLSYAERRFHERRRSQMAPPPPHGKSAQRASRGQNSGV